MDERLDDRNFLEGELHEKIIIRERRRKRILVSLALVLFLFLSGIPVYQERLLKWQSLEAARRIAVEIEKLKTESIQLKKPLKLTLMADGELKVEVLSDCGSAQTEKLYNKKWRDEGEQLSILSVDEAKKLKLNFVVDQLCFDPVNGLAQSKMKKVLVVLPVKDLAESRLDRASYVEVETANARISIN
jgi:hypothetical protein